MALLGVADTFREKTREGWYHQLARKTELRETALHNGLEKRYEMALNEMANYKFPILVCFISVHIAAAFKKRMCSIKRCGENGR